MSFVFEPAGRGLIGGCGAGFSKLATRGQFRNGTRSIGVGRGGGRASATLEQIKKNESGSKKKKFRGQKNFCVAHPRRRFSSRRARRLFEIVSVSAGTGRTFHGGRLPVLMKSQRFLGSGFVLFTPENFVGSVTGMSVAMAKASRRQHSY